MMVPKRSMCEMGFSVSLPMSRAVWSPSLFAIQPWATSCSTMAKISGGAMTTIFCMVVSSSMILSRVVDAETKIDTKRKCRALSKRN